MVIVTGANGFIGSMLVWDLNQRGISDILCVDSVSPIERPLCLKGLRYRQFLHRDELFKFLQTKPEISAILHMGACSSTSETNQEYLHENNTLYTNKLFSWCTENQKTFLYASSGATYGGGELGFDDNIDPELLQPLNPYGFSKVESDRWVLRQEQTPPHWYGLRFFNVYGPREYHKGEQSSVVYKAFLQIKESGTLKLFKSHNPQYKDGEQLRDFVYVKDITRWMLELIEKKPKSGIYNMGYGTARSWLDLATAAFSSMALPVNIEWIPTPEHLKKHYQYYTQAKIEKLKSQGISKPQWNLEEGIADYIKNHLLKDL